MLGNVAIIGGGKMGEVIASGILSNRLVLPVEVTVTDVLEERREYLKMEYWRRSERRQCSSCKRRGYRYPCDKASRDEEHPQGDSARLWTRPN